MAQKTRIAINGFGRIGKVAFKIAYEFHKNEVEVVAINDLCTTAQAAHVLKYDSVYRTFPHQVEYGDDYMSVDGVQVKKFTEKDPAQLPWKDLNIDVVLECTGVFTNKEGASKHLTGGAKAVIISAPAKDGDPVGTYVMGVNHMNHDAKKEPIISNASCTTNCIAPVMQVLEESFAWLRYLM